MKSLNIVLNHRLFLAGYLCVVSSLVGPSSGISAVKKKNHDQKLEPYALLVGTCFSEKGLGLGEVNIVVELQGPPGQKGKPGKWSATSDVRGEFAVRLPAGRNQFLIRASKGGFKPQEKAVAFAEDERQDIHFTLEPLPSSQ